MTSGIILVYKQSSFFLLKVKARFSHFSDIQHSIFISFPSSHQCQIRSNRVPPQYSRLTKMSYEPGKSKEKMLCWMSRCRLCYLTLIAKLQNPRHVSFNNSSHAFPSSHNNPSSNLARIARHHLFHQLGIRLLPERLHFPKETIVS